MNQIYPLPISTHGLRKIFSPHVCDINAIRETPSIDQSKKRKRREHRSLDKRKSVEHVEAAAGMPTAMTATAAFVRYRYAVRHAATARPTERGRELSLHSPLPAAAATGNPQSPRSVETASPSSAGTWAAAPPRGVPRQRKLTLHLERARLGDRSGPTRPVNAGPRPPVSAGHSVGVVKVPLHATPAWAGAPAHPDGPPRTRHISFLTPILDRVRGNNILIQLKLVDYGLLFLTTNR